VNFFFSILFKFIFSFSDQNISEKVAEFLDQISEKSKTGVENSKKVTFSHQF